MSQKLKQGSDLRDRRQPRNLGLTSDQKLWGNDRESKSLIFLGYLRRLRVEVWLN
jgi:hypothetical protein